MRPLELDPHFEELLAHLAETRGFDFTSYKRESVMRRVRRRMQAVGEETFEDYLHYLESNPDEFTELFNTILINVTAFFRDGPVWEFVGSTIIPRVLAAKDESDGIRVWSAGCASGEEPYTMAMLLAEALGEEEFDRRVKIYATDLDEEALDRARQASYSAKEVEPVATDLRERYFDRTNDHFAIRKVLRRAVVFGRHDLLRDAPISHIDLLLCRNTLMYFQAAAQEGAVAQFHYAVSPEGYLLLGKAETLLRGASVFAADDLKHRVFKPVRLPRDDVPRAFRSPLNQRQAHSERAEAELLRRVAFDLSPIAELVVDSAGFVVALNREARSVFGLSGDDLGRPLRDLEVSYRPIELRSLIEQGRAEHRPVYVDKVGWTKSDGQQRTFDIKVVPLPEGGEATGASITFADSTVQVDLEDELRHSKRELESAYEELQSTNEELETTNEELQSTNEELETTNEELQSANEELETMNEELQSTNAELQTMNERFELRAHELDRTNAFLGSILGSLSGSVIVLDGDLRIQIWSESARELWGLLAGEAEGQSFLELDIGLPVQQLREPLLACLARSDDAGAVMVEAVDRRGRAIECRVSCSPLLSGDGVNGVVMLLEAADSRS